MSCRRVYVIDPRTRRTVDGLSLHKRTGQHYSLKAGQRKYWGTDRIAAIDEYQASLDRHPLRVPTDREALQELWWAGIEVDEDEVTPEQLSLAKQGKFVADNEWIDSNPTHPLSIFMVTGKWPKDANGRLVEFPSSKPRQAVPLPKEPVNPDGLRTLAKAGEQWKEDKSEGEDALKSRTIGDYLRYWDEFVVIARRHGVTELAQLDKAFFKAYRSKVIAEAEGSPTYYSNRFRCIKAILRHTLIENDPAGVDEAKAGYIMLALKTLKCKITTAENRYITADGLHAVLRVCDELTLSDESKLVVELSRERKGSSKYQSLVSQIRRAKEQRFFGIQFRAIYLMAVNCMFYPVDLATIPLEAVNFENGHVHFRRGKKDRVRVGLLLPATMEALKKWMAVRTSASHRLFVNSVGTPWTKQKLHDRLQDHKAMAKVIGTPMTALDGKETDEEKDNLTWKAFRKGGYRAALQDQRVDLYTAKILAGHETGITESYVDGNPERCRIAAEAIGHFYGLAS